MKIEVSGFGRCKPKSKGGHDIRDRAGKVIFKAADDMDAALLALLYRVVTGVMVKDEDCLIRLYKHLRAQVTEFEDHPLWDTVLESWEDPVCPICGGTEHADPLPGTVGKRCVKCCNIEDEYGTASV